MNWSQTVASSISSNTLAHYLMHSQSRASLFFAVLRSKTAIQTSISIMNALVAMRQGDVSAQFNVGVMYGMGQGVVRDYAEAAKWTRLAAEQGNASAQYNLGVTYNNGQGVLQDYAEAVKWYRLAAQQDHASAQNNLGFMYHSGKGVLQNYVKAHSWYNLSAAKGTATAAENRDGVAKRMTPQQIADAKKLARDCQALQFKGCD